MDRSHPATGCGRPLPPHTTLLSLSLRSLLRAYEPTASSLLVPAWNSQALLDAMAPNIIDYMTFDVLCQRKGAQGHTICSRLYTSWCFYSAGKPWQLASTRARPVLSLWLDRIDITSASVSSASRRHLERMSPTAGPPSTLTISAVLPPSSETGRMCVTLVVSCRRCPVNQQSACLRMYIVFDMSWISCPFDDRASDL